MSQKPAFSLLQPSGVKIEYKILPEQVMHDLGLDAFCKEISGDATERRMIANVLSKISSDPAVSVYRRQIFGDIYRFQRHTIHERCSGNNSCIIIDLALIDSFKLSLVLVYKSFVFETSGIIDNEIELFISSFKL